MENRKECTQQKMDELFVWCLQQAAARYMGDLSQDRIDDLNSINFPWHLYEAHLDLKCLYVNKLKYKGMK